ncbi:enoyl-CoA hydratase/isomerase family protein [Frigidibacter mobilis]|uniref:Enoyl-CoA hydratase n=1 Tax=Frigidibacter mobilis TaxID=1335048 RepID=A0A165STV9_9RHOB|nr:enoyl-CoA hydratase/isomerase family protein [Frigidibacter mobilis]AMY71033.1 enoyl-CoA hydratase [Frigidibacter mobilis]
MELETLKVGIADHIAVVTISRPPVNAQNNMMRADIQTVFDALGDRADVRSIILTGEGKAFSAGADLAERPSQEPGHYTAHNRRVRASFDCILECPKPVIAAVNGAAIGAGCVTALCCDILVASDNAFLSMTEVMVGLAGGVAHVRRHFGESDARLMILTGRRIYGPELLRMNAVSACTSPEELMATALSIAQDIAKASPSAVIAAKKSFAMTENLSIYEGYRFEQSQTKALASSEDTAEAMAAFREKRKPVFRG